MTKNHIGDIYMEGTPQECLDHIMSILKKIQKAHNKVVDTVDKCTEDIIELQKAQALNDHELKAQGEVLTELRHATYDYRKD